MAGTDDFFGQGTGGTASTSPTLSGAGSFANAPALSVTTAAATTVRTTATAGTTATRETGPIFSDDGMEVELPEESVTHDPNADGGGTGSETAPPSPGDATGNNQGTGSDPGIGTIGGSFLSGSGSGSGSSSGSTEFSPNVLDNFFQVAYHLRLYTSGDGSSSSGNKTITIAESGVTGFNIREFTFESAAMGPNGSTGNVVATNFSMTIAEPMGTSFLDAMFLSAQQAGVANWQKVFYSLDVSFKGYDESGAPNNNICASFPNGGTWTWRLIIKDIATQLSATGSVYTLTGIMMHDAALEKHTLYLEEAYAVEASTVGEFFNQLKQKLNQNVKTKYKTDLITYEFKFVNANGSGDPASYKIVLPDTKVNSYKSFSFANGTDKAKREVPVANIVRGTSIPDLIKSVIGVTEEGQKFARDSNGSITGKSPTDHLGQGNFRDSGVFRVHPQVEFGKYDPVTANYRLKITFNVKMFKFQNTFLPNETQKATENSPKAVQEIQKYKGLAKRYDYIFTGLNTQVIDFDVKYNFAWQAVLPRFEGTAYYGENLEVHATYSEDARQQFKKLKQAQAQEAAGNAQQSAAAALATNNALTGGPNIFSAASGAFTQGVQTAAAGAAQQVQSRTEIENSFAAAQAQIPSLTSGSSAYAEDLLSAAQSNGSQNPIPISISSSAENARRDAGSGFASPWHGNKSIYGAILEQVEVPITTSLLSVNITVKGDPYWLGVRYEDMFTSTSATQTQVVDYSFGDVCFLLNFRYPYNLGDGATPNFRSQDVFSGIYRAVRINHIFSDGVFKQAIQAQRMPKILPKEVQGLASKQ